MPLLRLAMHPRLTETRVRWLGRQLALESGRRASLQLLLQIVSEAEELRFLQEAAVDPDACWVPASARPTGTEMLG